MVQALADLKILGVRPKGKALTEALESPGGRTIDGATRLSMNSLGFRLSRDGYLVPDEGAVQIGCSDGISYSLRFGRVTFARGEALSAGKGEDTTQSEAPGNGSGRQESGRGG